MSTKVGLIKDRRGNTFLPQTDASLVTGLSEMVYNTVYPEFATTQPAGGFLPNTVYYLGELSGSVTFALATPTDNTRPNCYKWTFETGSTAPTITWPTGLDWKGGSAPVVAASKHYEIFIEQGYATYLEF